MVKIDATIQSTLHVLSFAGSIGGAGHIRFAI